MDKAKQRIRGTLKILYKDRDEFMEWLKDTDREYYEYVISMTTNTAMMTIDSYRFPYLLGMAQSQLELILKDLEGGE